MGSDFSPVEQRLVRALAWLKPRAAGVAKLRLLAQALAGGAADDAEAMARMGLDTPHGLGERLEARVLALALRRTAAT
jgi:hypothetical protein